MAFCVSPTFRSAAHKQAYRGAFRRKPPCMYDDRGGVGRKEGRKEGRRKEESKENSLRFNSNELFSLLIYQV
jgi:hypothetical protein